ncbi:MAG: hypothetical protein Q8K30_02390 [Candidatus Gracilibacteria bacterium]|nr:hypothetical protein [Candidatus Gracilibacteria bacterium]
MKKVIYFIIFNILILLFNKAGAIDIEYNTEYNIKRAILVEDYVIRHKEKIDDFIIKYDLIGNDNLFNDLKIINESIVALKKIQNTNIEKKKADDIMQAVLDRIKIVNENLKTKLKIEKEKFKEKLNLKKQNYQKLGIKITDKIYNINLKIAKNIIKQENGLSLKELEIKNNLIILTRESQKLKNFGNMDFKSEKEMRDEFIQILKNIKSEINYMNETLR